MKHNGNNGSRSKRNGQAPNGSLGPVENLEHYLQPDWWRRIFNSMYLKTDADVVEDMQITCKEVQQKKHSLYSLHRAREEKIFLKPRKLVGVITEDQIVLARDDHNTFVTDGLYLFGLKPSMDARYVMGVLNSRLFVFVYRLLSLEEGRTLAQVKPAILVQLPIRTIDSSSPNERTWHAQLVTQVDKMQALVPKLRLARSETERATLQNAITATDRQIDALVYELYGLTREEIKLVEKS